MLEKTYKIHFLYTFQILRSKKIGYLILCNGNGVPNLSLKKHYVSTKNRDEVTCKKCLTILKNRVNNKC